MAPKIANWEIAVYALHILGGGLRFIPTEDIAVKCFEIAPDVFSSIKYPNQRGVIIASIPGQKCCADVISLDPAGPSIKIELKDVGYGNQRYRWQQNVLQIAARHPSLNRYLVAPPAFLGQETKHYSVLLAEIVAEAVCARLLSRNADDQPGEYSDFDWDAYYAEYCRMMTKFLPIAHETQVKP